MRGAVLNAAQDSHGLVERRLRTAGAFYLVAFGVHTLDHLLRGRDSVTEALYVAGFLSSLLSVVVIVLALTGHRLAAPAAVAIGFPQAAAFLGAHFLPTWSALSDSFLTGDVGWQSWVAGALEIAGALAVGFAGTAALRARARRPGTAG